MDNNQPFKGKQACGAKPIETKFCSYCGSYNYCVFYSGFVKKVTQSFLISEWLVFTVDIIINFSAGLTLGVL